MQSFLKCICLIISPSRELAWSEETAESKPMHNPAHGAKHHNVALTSGRGWTEATG